MSLWSLGFLAGFLSAILVALLVKIIQLIGAAEFEKPERQAGGGE